jgi:hypothetical protein
MTRDDYFARINDAFAHGTAADQTAAIESFIMHLTNDNGHAAAGIIRFLPEDCDHAYNGVR